MNTLGAKRCNSIPETRKRKECLRHKVDIGFQVQGLACSLLSSSSSNRASNNSNASRDRQIDMQIIRTAC